VLNMAVKMLVDELAKLDEVSAVVGSGVVSSTVVVGGGGGAVEVVVHT